MVVTVPPLKPYVDEILRGITTSQSLTRPGQDAHNFGLSPTQSNMLEGADIVIIPDGGLNPLMKRLTDKLPKVRVIELSALPGAAPLPYAVESPWLAKVKEAAKEKDEDDEKPLTNNKLPPNDPHLWLDPERMAAIAKPLASAIGEFAPSQKRTMEDNATELAAHLRGDVLPGLQAMLVPKAGDDISYTKPEIPFITYHAGYQYFMKRFGLTSGGELMTRPEDYQGAKTLDAMLGAAKKVHIRCIFAETETTVLRRIAQLSGARIVPLSPEQIALPGETLRMNDWAKNEYDRFLQKTAQKFSECL